jgi:hypothetical protein
VRLRAAFLVATIAACGAVTLPALAREDRRVTRAREYVARYLGDLVRVVGDEHYVQGALRRTRVLDSEFAWIAIPSRGETIGVREVLRVDGRPVSDEPRLRRLLEGSAWDVSRDFEGLLAESATHNLGDVQRNINFPTFALAYLRVQDDGRVRWRAASVAAGLELQFEERGRATVIRSPDGRPTPARGAFLVDAATGRILRSSIAVSITAGGPKREYRVDVDFAEDVRLALWVPVRMSERAISPDGEVELACEATYTNYRRYETGARLVR